MTTDLENNPPKNLAPSTTKLTNNHYTWNLSGSVSQDVALPRLPFTSGTLFINAHRFTHIASIAIRRLVDYFDSLPETVHIRFTTCSLSFCDMITMVPELLGRGNNNEAILSVILEMLCSRCEWSEEHLISCNPNRSIFADIASMDHVCSHCKSPTHPPKFYKDALFAFTQEFQEARAQSIARRELSELVHQVTHDYKTTLGFLEQFSFGDVSEQRYDPEARSVLQASLRRVLSMLEGLKDAESGTPHFAMISLNIKAIIDELRPLAKAKNVAINISSPKLPTFYIDQLILERTLINLLANALEAAKSSVWISANLSNANELIISVSDDGPGIDKNFESQLFSKGATIGKADGQGRGLYFAHYGARIHQGNISYARESGKTIFTLILPKIVPTIPDDEDLHTQIPPQADSNKTEVVISPPNTHFMNVLMGNWNGIIASLEPREAIALLHQGGSDDSVKKVLLITEEMSLFHLALDHGHKSFYINPELSEAKKTAKLARFFGISGIN